MRYDGSRSIDTSRKKTGRHLGTHPTVWKKVSRRSVLQGMARIGVAGAVGPWIVSPKVLASSGEVNVLMWSGHLPPGFLKAFSDTTGIKVNYASVGSNDEILNKMKSTGGKGVDICSPTNMWSLQWVDLDVLQPFDYERISNLGNVNPAMLKVGEEEWNFGNKGSHWLPHIWGTEGVAWRTDLWTPPRLGERPSYGDVWQADVKGKAMIRPRSGLVGAGSLSGNHRKARTGLDEKGLRQPNRHARNLGDRDRILHRE